MKKQKFYETLDKIENLIENNDELMAGYFPIISEIEANDVTKDLDTYLPIITYFANDPYESMGKEEANLKEYKATVKFCKDILSKINLE